MKIKLISDTYMQQIAPQEVESRYLQLDNKGVAELLIKFIKKEGGFMEQEVKYVIVSDVENKIEYQEVYNKELDREAVANRRARLEALKEHKLDIEKEIAEIEAELELAEKIIAIADEKKAQEQAELEAQNEVVGE